jgi:hypothetical protein
MGSRQDIPGLVGVEWVKGREWRPSQSGGVQSLTAIWAPVAHVCNPSYSGGRDQEDHGLKAAQANSL